MTEQYKSVLKSPNIDKPQKTVVALGGDGIGPEVVNATVLILEGMNINGIEIKNSATKPVMIPIICEKNNIEFEKKILFKME